MVVRSLGIHSCKKGVVNHAPPHLAHKTRGSPMHTKWGGPMWLSAEDTSVREPYRSQMELVVRAMLPDELLKSPIGCPTRGALNLAPIGGYCRKFKKPGPDKCPCDYCTLPSKMVEHIYLQCPCHHREKHKTGVWSIEVFTVPHLTVRAVLSYAWISHGQFRRLLLMQRHRRDVNCTTSLHTWQ
jgi:hypothetical protein